MARKGSSQHLLPWISYAIVMLLVLHLLLPFCIFADDSSAEERAIYLVLMEGDAVAFHQLIVHKKLRINNTSSYDNVINNNTIKHGYDEALANSLVESHHRLLETSLEAGSYDKLYSFHQVINGFAVYTTPSQARRLESAEGVVMVEKDRGVKLMTTYTPEFLGLPERVWAQRVGPKPNNAGEGMVIGIVDTGINPWHPSFAYDPSIDSNRMKKWDPIRFLGTCDIGPMFPIGSCNGKILSARYFWTGASKILPIDPLKDLSPFDQIGHGSHVASIAAGNKGVPVIVNGFNYGHASGMAPRARIAVYKVLYPQGGSVADVISAVDQAVRDGVDVLSLSVGPDDPPTEAPIFMHLFDILLLFARRAGVFVAQAAGNKGPRASSVISYNPWSVAVAASSTHRTYATTLALGDGSHLVGVGISGPTYGNGKLQFKLVAAKDAGIANGNLSITPQYAEECQHAEALQPLVVRGRIVICNFSSGFIKGTSSITAILNTAKTLGFMGFVLVANPIFGDLVAEPLPFTMPGIMIPKVGDVKILMDYYGKQTYRDQRGNVIKYNGRAAIQDGRIASFDDDNPLFVARFSSRGPDIIDKRLNPVDVLKPDILAPGHQIWAAWSPTSAREPFLRGYNFVLMSGTSMATPHVSGIAALIKRLRPSWTPSMVFSAISTTASKFDSKGRAIMSQGPQLNTLYPSTPFDYGAGLINPSKALDPGLVFSSGFEDYVAFLCSLPNMDPSRVAKSTGRSCNNNNTAMFLSPTDLNLPSITVSQLKGSLLVKRNVINTSSKSETYLSSILPPRGVKVDVHPSWFSISPQRRQDLQIMLTVTEVMGGFNFGEIVLTGSLDHIVILPLSVNTVSM